MIIIIWSCHFENVLIIITFFYTTKTAKLHNSMDPLITFPISWSVNLPLVTHIDAVVAVTHIHQVAIGTKYYIHLYFSTNLQHLLLLQFLNCVVYYPLDCFRCIPETNYHYIDVATYCSNTLKGVLQIA